MATIIKKSELEKRETEKQKEIDKYKELGRLEYQGLTNSMQFVPVTSEKVSSVYIEKAYKSYMQPEENMIEFLKSLINTENEVEAMEMLNFVIKRHANMYYTLYEVYKNYKAI